MTNNMKLDDVY